MFGSSSSPPCGFTSPPNLGSTQNNFYCFEGWFTSTAWFCGRLLGRSLGATGFGHIYLSRLITCLFSLKLWRFAITSEVCAARYVCSPIPSCLGGCVWYSRPIHLTAAALSRLMVRRRWATSRTWRWGCRLRHGFSVDYCSSGRCLICCRFPRRSFSSIAARRFELYFSRFTGRSNPNPSALLMTTWFADNVPSRFLCEPHPASHSFVTTSCPLSAVSRNIESQVSSKDAGRLPDAEEPPLVEVWKPKEGLFGVIHPLPWKKGVSEFWYYVVPAAFLFVSIPIVLS